MHDEDKDIILIAIISFSQTTFLDNFGDFVTLDYIWQQDEQNKGLLHRDRTTFEERHLFPYQIKLVATR